MLKINGLKTGLEVFRTLGSEVRMRIVQLLAEQGEMNLGAIASALDMTNGAVTTHIRKLEEAGIIRVSTEHSARGMQKVCSLQVDEILFDISPSQEERKTKSYETQVGIGEYSDYEISSPCGLAGEERMIGDEDDLRSFSYPERFKAAMLYFHDGYVEYRIPNLLPNGQKIVQITLSFEISSAEMGDESDTTSDISFHLNGRYLGEWRSIRSEDFSRGIFTPMWWKDTRLQHGFLKMIVINEMGIFLDGARIQEQPHELLKDCEREMKLRFEAHPRDGREGGLSLFGDHFGNYNQNIQVRVHYMPKERYDG